MKSNLKASILLLIAAAIWGFTFVAQSKGMEYIGAMTFSASRCLIAGVVILLMHRITYLRKLVLDEETIIIDKAATRRGGILAGVILFFAMNIQQIGISGTTAGKAGFISALYIILVPIFLSFKGYKISRQLVFCIFISMVGIFLLSVKENFTVNVGDVIVFISTIFFTLHLLLLAKYSAITDGIKFNAYQFIVCGILSLIGALLIDNISWETIKMAMGAILYAAILSSAVAFTLQIIALRHIDTTIASLICSVESIFAAIGGYVVLGEVLSLRELIGCILMLLSTILAQLRFNKNEN